MALSIVGGKPSHVVVQALKQVTYHITGHTTTTTEEVELPLSVGEPWSITYFYADLTPSLSSATQPAFGTGASWVIDEAEHVIQTDSSRVTHRFYSTVRFVTTAAGSLFFRLTPDVNGDSGDLVDVYITIVKGHNLPGDE